MIIPESELERIHQETRERVQLRCDEFHAHTVDCLDGPADAMTILRLVAHAQQVNGKVRELFRLLRQLPRPHEER